MGRHHQSATGPQDPMDLAQSRGAIVDVMDRERQQGGVDAPILEPVEGRSEVVHANVEAIPDSPTCETNHLRALIEADDLGPACDELLGVEAWAAPGVQDPLSLHVTEELENGRAMGVVGTVVGAVELVLLREVIEERIALSVHARRLSRGRTAGTRCPG